jgi:lysophospholipase L1-like esterase
VGGRTGSSGPGNGIAEITGVPEGTHALSALSAPPYFQARHQVTVQVPQPEGEVARFPVTVDIGGNRPKVYMAFGDSLTLGIGSSPGGDYPNVLQSRLVGHFASAIVSNRGDDGSNSWEGLERARRNVRGVAPAFSLIMYGTNDWHTPECKVMAPCSTPENLREIIETIKDFNSLPFLATLPPVNPVGTDPGRNDWVEATNEAIRVVAVEEGAVLVDVHAALTQLAAGDLGSLFSDHVHLNDTAYATMAETFFEAIAYGRSTPGTASARTP